MAFDVDRYARQQLDDYDAKTPGSMFSHKVSMTLPQAYAIQKATAQLREDRGESVCGYKVGCTSPAMQGQLGIDHPVFGRLFDSEQWSSGAELKPSQFAALAIEGELAVRMGADLPIGVVTAEAALGAVESAFVVVELHNYIFRQDAPTAVELVANNAINAGFVRAESDREITGQRSGMHISIDQAPVASVTDTDFSQQISESLVWLAYTLSGDNKRIQSGETILCGSLANLFPVNPGSRVEVTTECFGSVSCCLLAN